ncbi:MAG: DUF1833 family protein [Alphaproteobacteria bacterium]|nr:DUF1833 family protein [Alphaproteobacteria bacterium]
MAYDWQLLDLGGTSRRSVSTFRYLSFAPSARIDDSFLASAPGYLVNLELLTTGRCLLDIEPTAAKGNFRGIDFTDAFEAGGRMTLFAGGMTLSLSGFDGDTEPYRWTPANSAEVTAFVNGYVDGTPARLLLELGDRQALPAGLRAGLRLGEPETDVEAYAAALRTALRPAPPVAEVEAPARALGASLRPGVPIADVEALPGPLRTRLDPRPPKPRIRARAENLRIALRPSAPIAGTTAYPPALRIAQRTAQPLPLFDARPGAVRIALRPAVPRGRTKAHPGDLEIAVRPGSAAAYREAAPATLRAALDVAAPTAHVEAFPGALRAALDVAAPATDVEALPRTLRAALRARPPAGIATGRAAALPAGLRPGVPAAVVAAFPRTLAAVLRPGPPRAIPYPGEPADRGRSHARSLVGRNQTFALEIEHPAITEPVRVVADTVEHAVEGNRYVPLAFHARVPQAKEGEIRTAVLRIDNVGRELMQWVEASRGGRDASMRVLRLIPPAEGETGSTVAWEVEMSVGVAEVTNEYVTVSLTDEPVFGRPTVILRHDPATSPGLF